MTKRIAAMTALLAVATACSTGSSASPQPSGSTTTPGSGIPVVRCVTTYGVEHTPKPVPSPIAPHAMGVNTSAYEYYVDVNQTATPILAPKGWDCHGQVGADGSTVIAAFPAGQPIPDYRPGFAPTPSNAQMVMAYSPSACVGCIADLVCSLLPSVSASFGLPTVCPVSKPPTEKVTTLHTSGSVQAHDLDTTLAFEDPSNVIGSATPSGGDNPANGVLLVRLDKAHDDAASTETCVMPQAQHATCTTILDDFVAQRWSIG